jgi:branched-chain amino acid transport system permease protein
MTINIAEHDITFYYFLLVVFAIATGLQGLLLASPFGRTLVAIRENERRARFLGIPIERHIWMSFSISCCFTALAGSLYAWLNSFADPMVHFRCRGNSSSSRYGVACVFFRGLWSAPRCSWSCRIISRP